jgi:two-component system sensor histidine kinase KdpD
VGKTYAMLREGHRLRSEGREVVVGLIETHDRRETEAQVGDLEVVPRRTSNHGGVTIAEMDTPAIIARHPEIALIDELAHTNAPGSLQAKRYEDVLDLLDHGIDVITTMNIQHLESVQGLVSSITGVDVREIVPDAVLDQAEDIQLVDLPAGALIDRLHAGKVYPQHRIDAALTGFFRPGNLAALRELALRRTAEDVDDELTDLMFAHGDGLISASDRLLVIADASDQWGAVLRAAWRLASVLRGSVVVLTLTPDGTMDTLPALEKVRLERNLRLAEDLGAELITLPGEPSLDAESVDLLVDLIRRERISMLVLGVSPRKRGLFHRANPPELALAAVLLEQVESLQMHLVGLEDG